MNIEELNLHDETLYDVNAPRKRRKTRKNPRKAVDAWLQGDLEEWELFDDGSPRRRGKDIDSEARARKRKSHKRRVRQDDLYD